MKKNLNLLLSLAIAFIFLQCNRLDTIEYSPKLTPEAFLKMQDWMKIEIFNLSFILSQPTSSIIVYFVSLFDLYVAYVFLINIQNQKSRLWWGIGLIFTGVGALLAGTSYQAFGYELKCGGRETCRWTNWFEINYELLSAVGMNAFLVACAYSNAEGKFRKGLILYAIINTIVYCLLTLYGAFVPIQFLVSFEFLTLASTPTVIFFIWLYTKDYNRTKNNMNLYLRNTWIILILVMVVYMVYLILGFTAPLWEKGIWFTENDVLHVGMVYWVYYIMKKLPNEVKDLQSINQA